MIQFSLIYQEILILFLSDEWLQIKSIFYVWFINTHKKKKTLPSLKNFMEKEGVNKIIHTPSPNILQGNGVVFEIFTINNL